MFAHTIRLGLAVAVLSLPTASALGAQAPAAAPLTAAQKRAALLDPTKSLWTARAPAIVAADIETTRGTISIELVREWAPAGVDHFYNLARAGYYDDSRFYRVIYGYIAQFGIAGVPRVADIWGRRKIPADPVREHNVRGTISYAQFKPTDRSTNVFINLRDNPQLDTLKFAPFARVVQGMDVVDSLYAFYGEFPAAEAPLGNPKRLYGESNRYLDEKFPLLDKILKITIRPE